MTPSLPSIEIPVCKYGIGSVIQSMDSPHKIEGVSLQPSTIWPDDRGYFMEILRVGNGAAKHFEPQSTQVSAAINYPGVIKAFHFHKHQTDFWVPVSGMLQVVLVDFRKDSPTWGVKNTLYLGTLRPWSVLIPPGVGHGYKVIGTEPSALVYVTNRFYNPEDEGRVPHNNESIAYDWELQHK